MLILGSNEVLVEYDLRDKYKILVYTDSLVCTSCKLYLPEEDALLTEKSKKLLSKLQEDDNPCIIKYRH